MNRDNIRIVLAYCKKDIKFFLLNKDIEVIYCTIIYSSSKGQNKIKLESYEQNKEFIYSLYQKGITDFRLYDYWTQNHSRDYKLKIYWKALLNEDFNTIDDVVADLYINDTENPETDFSNNFINLFRTIIDKFKLERKSLFRYKQYQVQYIKNYILCLDWHRNNFVIFGANNKDEIEIVCNKFYHRTKDSYENFVLRNLFRSLHESAKY